MSNFAQNSRFKFTDYLVKCITTPSSLTSHHLSIFESLALIKVLPSLDVFLYLGPHFTLCKFLFLLIPFSNTIGHTNYVGATFWPDSWIKFGLLAFCCPKVAISPSASTECQTASRSSHITNSIPVRKATISLSQPILQFYCFLFLLISSPLLCMVVSQDTLIQ